MISELTVDQDKHKDSIPRLNPDDPMFHWIFRNVDFEEWSDSSEYQVLWLSGQQDRNFHQVSSYIVDLERERVSRTEHIVLFFFCSSAVSKPSAVSVFVYAPLRQALCYSPTEDKKVAIVKAFLQGILEDGHLEQYSSKGTPQNKILKKVRGLVRQRWVPE
ncbi:hypothetical protein VTN00DRAFT_9075 [Thermoascus crustaceus]|uniref:uncharacterized protein n=1 Tax=Thermoascus crustaceus TaxID=5088 RepID=UPI003743890A